MATLKIADNSGTALVDLVSGTFTVFRGAWTTRTQQGTVDEVMTLVSRASDADILAAEVAIQNMIARVDAYHASTLSGDPIWLYSYADGEQPKRALIYSVKFEPMTKREVHRLLGGRGAYRRLVITRSIVWEATTMSFVMSNPFDYSPGGMVRQLSADGSIDNRISELAIKCRSSCANSGEIWRGIVGLRAYHYGVSDFEPSLSATDAVLETFSGVSVVSDPDATNGETVSCPLSGTMRRKMYFRLGEFTSSPSHYYGEYVLMLRCRVTNSDTVGAIQANAGFYRNMVENTIAPAGETVYLDGADTTAYRHVDVGRVIIPPFAQRAGNAVDLSYYTIEIKMQGLSGSGAIFVDRLILMPAERMAVIEGGSVRWVAEASSGVPMGIWTLPTGEIVGYANTFEGDDVYLSSSIAVSIMGDFTIPVIGGDAALVVIGEQRGDVGQDGHYMGKHDINDVFFVDVFYYHAYHIRRET